MFGVTSCHWFDQPTEQKIAQESPTTPLVPLGDDAEAVLFRSQGKIPLAPLANLLGSRPSDSVHLWLWATGVPSYPHYFELTGQALITLNDSASALPDLFLVNGYCDSAQHIYRFSLKSVSKGTQSEPLEAKLVPPGGEVMAAKGRPVLRPLPERDIQALKTNLIAAVANLPLKNNEPVGSARSHKSMLIGIGKDTTEFRLFFGLRKENKYGVNEKVVEVQPKNYLTELILSNPEYHKQPLFRQLIVMPEPFLLKLVSNPEVNALSDPDVFSALKKMIELVDSNLDGYMDLKVLEAQSPQRDVYRLMLYDPAQKVFIDHGQLVNPDLDDQNGLLTTTDNGVEQPEGEPGNWITHLKYSIKDGRIWLHQAEQIKADGKGQPQVFVRQNGRWQVLVP
ncbi:MAG: hypothetical protein MUC97_01335 [Bernardetiaceae bacterium]|nr:hypothetical protein [Bernardetiaceae bacterium]